MRFALAAIIVFWFCPVASGADYCRDFTRAANERDDALYQGFVHGYVMGWTRNRNPIATRAVAEQVSRLTAKYCLEKPNDDLASVVGMWTEVVVKSLK